MFDILKNTLIAELIRLAREATQTFARAANTLAPPMTGAKSLSEEGVGLS